MKLFTLFELCIYFALLPIVYKIIIAIDFSKIFNRNRTIEIRSFYLIVILVITKILGDFIIMIMDTLRDILGITV